MSPFAGRTLALLIVVGFAVAAAPRNPSQSLPPTCLATADRASARPSGRSSRPTASTATARRSPKGDLDLSAFTTAESVAEGPAALGARPGAARGRAMPPEKAKQQPTAEAATRGRSTWIEAVRKHEAQRNAGDPGPVLARRLSNAEYDYTIRDLTGVDIRPTREFPVDPANEAGFDNSGESLAMSPALLKKYLEAARRVADHLVLKPDGLRVRPASGRRRHRPRQVLRQPDHRLLPAAADRLRRLLPGRLAVSSTAPRSASRTRRWPTSPPRPGVSPKYLATVWSALTEPPEEVGPIAALQAMWRELPDPDGEQPDAARAGCERMRDFVVELRQQARAGGQEPDRAAGSTTARSRFVLWKNRQFAANRMRYAGGALADQGHRTAAGHARPRRRWPCPPTRTPRERYEAAFDRFCATFPDAFFVSERGPRLPRPEEGEEATGRLLSAGFHSMMGYFRDDGPLYELILDDARAARARPPVARARLHHRRPDAAVHELHLVRAGRLALHARPRVRLRPLRGQGRHVRGEDQAAGRGLPGQGARATAPSDVAHRGDRGLLPRHLGRASAGSSRRGWPPSRATSTALADVRRAGLPPAAVAGRARRPARVLSLAAREGRAEPRGRDARHASSAC